MIALWVAAGVLGTAGIGPTADIGAVPSVPERTAMIARVQARTAHGAGIPFGAVRWAQPFDPGDRALFAFDWSALLDSGEKIADVQLIALAPAAAALGLQVDQAAGRRPTIDAAGKLVGLWFLVDQSLQPSVSFDADGVLIRVTMRILTDAMPPRQWERSAVLEVRQL